MALQWDKNKTWSLRWIRRFNPYRIFFNSNETDYFLTEIFLDKGGEEEDEEEEKEVETKKKKGENK